MKLTKSETNNAIITTLTNVRKHPNADRLMLATVLGTQVIVDLSAKDGDSVVYFDSNIRLSFEYLNNNNLYSSPEMNKDTTKKGYFGKNGRVRAQKFRGEISNGYVAPLESLSFIMDPTGFVNAPAGLKVKIGDEFTHINGIEICKKYMVDNVMRGTSKKTRPKSTMFHKHWDTKQLMREISQIPNDATLYVEEKIHGTSGRTSLVLCDNNKKFWQFWKEKQVWKVLSGTRRVDSIDAHLPNIRQGIEKMVAPVLHKGEEIYYEIYGYNGMSEIQKGFTYGCNPDVYKVLLYRVTITTPDGYCIDLDREMVYRRAGELGLEQPTLLVCYKWDFGNRISEVANFAKGKSALDLNTLREGIVVWFKGFDDKWTCLKHKSEEFLMLESKQKDEEIGDVEDQL